jgi:hypothetical protein
MYLRKKLIIQKNIIKRKVKIHNFKKMITNEDNHVYRDIFYYTVGGAAEEEGW